MTSPSTNLAWQLITATRPFPAVMFAAPVSAVESVVVRTAVTTALVSVMDAAQDVFATRDEFVSTFMIPVVLSPQKRVRSLMGMATRVVACKSF